ncbi:L,D-transpeptidase family protein [Paenibacillus marinisediminis]
MSKQAGKSQFTEQDQAYMKKYIEAHPDNRMAWYLLGKQYERAGEMSKAHYCYNQAGDIYKAFENVPLPIEAATERLMMKQEAKRLREQKSMRRRWIVRASLLLLLIAGLLTSVPSEQAHAPNEPPASPDIEPSVPVATTESAPEAGIYLSGEQEKELAASLLSAVKRTTASDKPSYVVSQPEEDSWKLWTLQPKPWYVVEPSDKSSEAEVQAINTKDCYCEAEQSKVSTLAANWAQQEQRQLLARSIVVAAVRMGTTPPPKLGELAGAYPNNAIAGVDPELIPLYEQAVVAWKAAGSPTDAKLAEDELFQSPETVDSPFQEALRIVVDKQTMRLAVISGDQIIRNYTVGLGGDRTPEGSFIITEKVVNPNGRANGSFGSRGMTLSDTLYAIHGTNEPDSVGKNESLGCVRMSKEDIEELFDMVPIGTEVQITNGKLPVKEHKPTKEDRYQVPLTPGQGNPNKVYKWLG